MAQAARQREKEKGRETQRVVSGVCVSSVSCVSLLTVHWLSMAATLGVGFMCVIVGFPLAAHWLSPASVQGFRCMRVICVMCVIAGCLWQQRVVSGVCVSSVSCVSSLAVFGSNAGFQVHACHLCHVCHTHRGGDRHVVLLPMTTMSLHSKVRLCVQLMSCTVFVACAHAGIWLLNMACTHVVVGQQHLLTAACLCCVFVCCPGSGRAGAAAHFNKEQTSDPGP
jgi:hypothetical protein